MNKSNKKNSMRTWLIFMLWFLGLSKGYSQTYLLDVGVEQYLPVPETSVGYVDHAVWACESPNITFIKKDAAGAIIKINSYFAKAVTVELVYVVKYLDNKGWTRQYTGYTYYNIQCTSSAPTIIPSVLTMKVGETYQLNVSSISDLSTVEWESYSPPIAKVSDQGLVTARKAGTTFIFATLPGMSSPLTCTVNVKDTKMSIKANYASGFVDSGTEITLSSNSTTANIYYTLDGSSPEVNGELYINPIVIDKDATLKAIAYDADGEKEPSDVLIREYLMKKVRLSATQDSTSLAVGTEVIITANPTETKIYYTTDGSEPTTNNILYTEPLVATENFVLKAIGFCDGYEDSDPLVRNYRIAPEPTEIKMVPSQFELAVGHSQKISYKFVPSDASTLFLTWKSNDPSVASVSQDGDITAISPGQTTITVSAQNGVEGKCEVTVVTPRLQFCVWLRDGDVHRYNIEEEPEVKLGDITFTLTTEKQTIQYPAIDILYFTLQEVEENDIATQVFTPSQQNNVHYQEGMLHFDNCTKDSSVYIYDINGKMVLNTRTDSEGKLTLPLSDLKAGIYIIKTCQTTIKIQRK